MKPVRVPKLHEVSCVIHYGGRFWRCFKHPKRATRKIEVSVYEDAHSISNDYVELSGHKGEFSVDGIVIVRFSKITAMLGKRYPDVIHYFIQKEDE